MFGRHPLKAAAETNARSGLAAVAARKLSRTDGRVSTSPTCSTLIVTSPIVELPDSFVGLTAVIEFNRSWLRERDVDHAAVADRRVDSHRRWTRHAIALLRPDITAEAEADEGWPGGNVQEWK